MPDKLTDAVARHGESLERIRSEMEFGRRMARNHPALEHEWLALIKRAEQLVADGLLEDRGIEGLVAEAEAILQPLAETAGQYRIFCCGHGHFDMNWMWTWPETLAIAHDTFVTMDRLMDEFPQFHFSQSMTTVYQAVQKHFPELFERVQARVQEGRWEVTASQWVEGDKNMVSGESLCRQMLYSRQWLAREMGLEREAVKIAWDCDTFGFCATLPGILQRGGVTRLYHHRTSPSRYARRERGELSQLTWLVGKDGSRVLAWDDAPHTYNREISPDIAWELFNLERDTGLRSIMVVYGVGDHGGGPTRRHLLMAMRMQDWPIWPTISLTTSDDFFSAVEREIQERGLDIPENRDEINPIFPGCYTTETRIKFANRTSENQLMEAEALALVAGGLCSMPYPIESLREAWERTMFVQFHDILPGSGVRETVEHAMGMFQDVLAETGTTKTRALKMLADAVDTSRSACEVESSGVGLALGAGAGIGAYWSGVSEASGGENCCDPFVIFNPAPFERDELVRLRVWNRELSNDAVSVRDAEGHAVAGQVVERGREWGHDYATVAFPAREIPGLGWRTYSVEPGACAAGEAGVTLRQVAGGTSGPAYVATHITTPLVMINDTVELVISPQEGGITSLRNRATGREFVPEGEVLGAVLRQQEAPHSMTAWTLGAITETVKPLVGGTIEIIARGPHLAAIRLVGRHGQSDYALTISLVAGSSRVEFELDVNWLERGDSATGVPALRAVFPLAVEDGSANFEIPCGSIERPADGQEMPALNWVDLSGTSAEKPLGATLVNDSRYGHALSGGTIALTLLRSSYDPDPLPELGRHRIRYALIPHADELDVALATRQGFAFNHCCIAQGTDVHEGSLPTEYSALELLTPGVMLCGLKRAEDSEGLIVRLYEMTGEATTARLRVDEALAGPDATAAEVDLLERPLSESTASMSGGMLQVDLPAFGIATVLVEV